ncbi:MAG: hypothetical protein L0G46_09880, partial [Kocuria sp.]|nr:hypothetical protein [Kocuria sp.]
MRSLSWGYAGLVAAVMDGADLADHHEIFPRGVRRGSDRLVDVPIAVELCGVDVVQIVLDEEGQHVAGGLLPDLPRLDVQHRRGMEMDAV